MPIALSGNLVMPQLDSGFVINEYSIGAKARDRNNMTVSATSAINVIQPANASTFPSILSSTAQTSVSAIVDKYRTYASGTALFAGGNTTNYGLGSLIGAQVLSFSISAYGETYNKYHTNNDGSIRISFNGDTVERTPNNWQSASGLKQISLLVTVKGYGTTVVDSYTTAENGYIIASNLRAPYSLDVTVVDLSTRLVMVTTVAQNYVNPTPAVKKYQRVPYRLKLDSGAWGTDGGTTYYT